MGEALFHITSGDPAGVGPELLVRGLTHLAVSPPTVYGHGAVLEAAADRSGVSLPAMQVVEPDEPIDPDRRPGRAQVAYLESALKNVLRRPGDSVLVTLPISKAAAARGGLGHPGHTEFLAARSGVKRPAMMMVGPRLKVVLATTHVAVADLPSVLDTDTVASAVVLGAESLGRDFGIRKPRIGVSGLNPHCGEGGLFGDEEKRLITPAIRAARALLSELGVSARVDGPISPDTIFVAAMEGAFDAVVALYHDQGLIPVKLLDFHDTVNMTLGLPFVRTSPDHGVAYDLVGTGKARPDSFIRAVETGLEVWKSRNRA